MADRQLIQIRQGRDDLDLDFIHRFLTTSYWAEGVTRRNVERAVNASFCFGVYDAARQVGFARVLTDFVNLAHLADVFIDPEYRHRGLARQLLETILAHPELAGVRRWSLATRDAHRLYERFGFGPVTGVERMMERRSHL